MNGDAAASSSSNAAEASSNGTKRMRAHSASVPSESRLLELSVPISSRAKEAESREDKAKRAERLGSAVKELFSALGEDPEREGLVDTPKRAAEAFLFWTKGYEENLVGFIHTLLRVEN